ncbi:probable protein phosphatase 2C 50 isoform X1 [Tanacetum coccineum]
MQDLRVGNGLIPKRGDTVVVANYCSICVHTALQEELEPLIASWGSDENGTNKNDYSNQEMWRKAFFDCFLKVDDEIGGKQANDESNCGDSMVIYVEGKKPWHNL